MQKKRTKQHTLLKRQHTHYRAVLRQHAVSVVHLERGLQTEIVSLKSGRQCLPGKLVMEGLCDHPQRWSVVAAAVCRRQDGEQYIQTAGFTTEHMHRNDDLKALTESYVMRLKAEANQLHYLCGAWIATPYKSSVSDAHFSEILDGLGAWD